MVKAKSQPVPVSLIKRRIKILGVVVLVHVLVLVVPYIWGVICDHLKPPPEKAIEITLVPDKYGAEASGGPAGGSPGGGAPQVAAKPPPSEPAAAEPAPTFDLPDIEDSPPDVPTMKQPKPRPPTMKQPKPKQPTMKQPNPKPPQVVKPQVVKPVKKLLDASEIAISTKTVAIKQPRNVVKRNTRNMDQPYTGDTTNRADLMARLGRIASENAGNGPGTGGRYGNGKNGKEGDGTGFGGNGGEAVAAYGQMLAAYIKPRWMQPNQYELNHTKPSVLVRFYIAPSGVVMGAQIIQASNIPAMDRSVQKLLNSLRTVPPPPPGINTLEIRLQIED